jgi:hypothetical protein
VHRTPETQAVFQRLWLTSKIVETVFSALGDCTGLKPGVNKNPVMNRDNV